MVSTRRSSSSTTGPVNGPSPLDSLFGVLGMGVNSSAAATTSHAAAPQPEHLASCPTVEVHSHRHSSQPPHIRSRTRRQLTRSPSLLLNNDHESEEEDALRDGPQLPNEYFYLHEHEEEHEDVDFYPVPPQLNSSSNHTSFSSYDPQAAGRQHAQHEDGGDGVEQVSNLRAHHVRVTAPAPLIGRDAPGNSATLPNLALLCLAVAAVTLVLSLVIHLGIVAGGLIGPAWSTFKAIEKRPGAVPINRWAAFWIMSALVFALDRLVLAAFLKPWLPGPAYGLMLFLSLVWLSRDDAANTERLYGAFARPLFLRYEGTVDALFDNLGNRLDDITRFGLIQVSNVVKPIALQLDHAAAMARQQHDRIGEKRRLLKAISM